MAGDVIGSAVIEVTADATGLSAGIAQATQAVKGFETAATASGARAGAAMSKANKEATITSAQLTREQERLISTINNYSQTLGKSRGEVLEFRASQAGITDQVQAQIGAIRAQEAALRTSGVALNKYGISAGQTAAALRGVPAQLTDIVTSLQGGQAPLTVFLQQGGQLKDMFGGVVPAAKALGGALLNLINPYTVVAAAVATLGVAYAQGVRETENYNKALILTGNYLGKTVSDMQAYATAISRTVGTQGAAAEALTSLASSGKIAADQLTAVGTAVVYMNRVLGTSIEEATQTFTKLAEEPTKASAKLNESMHYLDLATYERIRALEEQGNKESAAALAQATLASETTARLSKIEASAGSLERGWRALADGAKSAWDAMLGVGRTQSIGERLAEAQGKLSQYQANVASNPVYGRAFGAAGEKFQQDVASLNRSLLNAQEKGIADGERARAESAKIAASDRLKKLSDEIATNASKRSKAIKQLEADYKTLGKATDTPEYRKQVSDINEKFKDPKEPKVKAFQDDAATKYLMQLRETEASLKEQLTQSEKLTNSQKELAKFEQQIADIKEKKTLTAEQKSLIASQDSILAQLQKNVAVEAEVEAQKKKTAELKKQKEAEDRFDERSRQRTEALTSNRQSRQDQYDRTLGAFGMSDQARQQIEDQKAILREAQRMQLDLVKNTPKHLLGSDKYIEESMKIKGALDQSLADHNTYYEGLKAKQGDWVNGATRALGTYIEEIQNVSAATERAVTTGLRGVEDGLTELFTTGKTSASKVAGQFYEEIVRSFVKKQITGPIAEWLQGELKGGANGLLGGVLSGGGKGGSLLGNLLGNTGKDAAAGAGLGSVSASSNTASLALTDLAAAAARATVAMGGGNGASGGGGSSWLSTLIGGVAGAFGGFDNGAATAMANASGGGLDDLFRFTNNFSGRAGGGFVGAGSIHEVVENGPELLTVGNKTLLMNGGQSGNVTPLKSPGRSLVVNNNFVLQNPASRETQAQISRRAAQAANTAVRRDS